MDRNRAPVTNFEDGFDESVRALLQRMKGGEPGTILVKKDTARPGFVTPRLIEAAGENVSVWHADCTDHESTIFEQIIPEGKRHITKVEKPPRVEVAIISNKTGMNLGTAQREESAMDPDIISGMMAAVRNFVKDSLEIHSDGELADGDFERFEMHGFNILIYLSENINISTILSGSIDKEIMDDLRTVAKAIEDDYGGALKDWNGSMTAIEGIERPLEKMLFSSRKYEGHWDYSQLMQLNAKMCSKVLREMERASVDGPLLICIENIESIQPESLAQLEHLARNLPFMTVGLVASGHGEMEDIGKTMEAVGHLSCLNLVAKEDPLERLENERDDWPTIRIVIKYLFFTKTFDTDMLAEITGISHERLDEVADLLASSGVIHGSTVDRSALLQVIGECDEEELYGILEDVVGVYENHRPYDFHHLAFLYSRLVKCDRSCRGRLIKYAELAAEDYTRSLNWGPAIEMWLTVGENSPDPQKRMSAYWNALEMQWMISDSAAATRTSRKLLYVATSENSEYYQGLAHLINGRLDSSQGDFVGAMANLKQAEMLFELMDEREYLAHVKNSKGALYYRLGKNAESLEAFRSAEAIAGEINHMKLLLNVRMNIGYNYVAARRYDEAEEIFDSVLGIIDDSGNLFNKPAALWNKALLRFYQEKYGECADLCRQAARLSSDMSNSRVHIQALTTLSAALDKLGMTEESDKVSLESLNLAERTGEGDILALTYNVFESHHVRSLEWMRKVRHTVRHKDVYPKTLDGLKSEILMQFNDYLDAIDELISPDCDRSRREEIISKLDRLKDRLLYD